jgi:membrane protease YdiL (CAAX protease family)
MDFRYYAAFLSEWLGAIGVAWLLSLSPRFHRPQIGFRYARRDGLVALSLFVLILGFAFLFYSFRPPVFPQPLRIAPPPVHDLLQALLVAAFCLVPFILAMLVRKQPVRAIGWNPALFRPALQMGFGIAVLTIFLGNRFMTLFGGLKSDLFLPLLYAAGVSLVEETIFRGYIQVRLVWWMGRWPGLLVTAALSAVWQLPVWMNHLPDNTIWILLALAFGKSLVLGWVMQKSGHVIAPALYRAISIWMQFI